MSALPRRKLVIPSDDAADRWPGSIKVNEILYTQCGGVPAVTVDGGFFNEGETMVATLEDGSATFRNDITKIVGKRDRFEFLKYPDGTTAFAFDGIAFSKVGTYTVLFEVFEGNKPLHDRWAIKKTITVTPA